MYVSFDLSWFITLLVCVFICIDESKKKNLFFLDLIESCLWSWKIFSKIGIVVSSLHVNIIEKEIEFLPFN